MDIRVTMDTRGFERDTEQFLRQLPFATALALNKTVGDARKDVREDLPSHFILRNKWVVGGVQTTPATKARLVAEIGHRSDFMELQAEGGDVRPKKGRVVAVPIAIRGDKRQLVRRTQWPAKLLAKRKRGYFVHQTAGGESGVFSEEGGRLRMLWEFRPAVPIRPRWPFADVVQRTVAASWGPRAAAAMARALRSAKR